MSQPSVARPAPVGPTAPADRRAAAWRWMLPAAIGAGRRINLALADARRGRPLAALLAAAVASLPAGAAAAPPVAASPIVLPDRVLTCRLGHVTNFDPRHEQTAAELAYDSMHPFALRLAAAPRREGPPPDVLDAPDPVSPRTRILADPDHIAPQTTTRFQRVVDQWPQRVEMTAPIAGTLRNAIVISLYDPARGTANLFMMRASELTHYDAAHMYQGTCTVSITAAHGAHGG